MYIHQGKYVQCYVIDDHILGDVSGEIALFPVSN